MTNNFNTFKQMFASAPCRATPDFSPTAKPFIVTIDFSQTAVGAVLSQEQNGVERFLGVKGRKCRPYESNYHSSKGELLALCYALTINTTIFLDCPSSAWLQILLQCCIGAR